jgi:aspartate aminotransferase
MLTTLKQLEPLLTPQERLDELFAAAFRRFGPRLVDLSYANPYEGPAEEVLATLRRVTEECKGLSLQYTARAGRPATRRAIADHLTCRFALPFDARDVILTSGAMPALNVVFRALFDSTDEVIVLTPAWHDYPLYLRNLDIPASFVPLGDGKHFDLDGVERAIGARTRGVLFSHPCCPTGVVYSEDEIRRLSAILQGAEARFGTSIYLVSDEVHRDLIWGGRTFFSPLLTHPRTVSIYSFGKALALQGQRIGYIAVSPRMPNQEDVRSALERSVRLMGFGTPTSIMQHVVCDLLDFQPSLAALAQKQACVRRALTGYGYDVTDGDATFYVYLKSPIADDFRFAEHLASRGVLVMPSTLFHEPGYVRLSLTARREAIAAGLPGFAGVLNELREHSTCTSLC